MEAVADAGLAITGWKHGWRSRFRASTRIFRKDAFRLHRKEDESAEDVSAWWREELMKYVSEEVTEECEFKKEVSEDKVSFECLALVPGSALG